MTGVERLIATAERRIAEAVRPTDLLGTAARVLKEWPPERLFHFADLDSDPADVFLQFVPAGTPDQPWGPETANPHAQIVGYDLAAGCSRRVILPTESIDRLIALFRAMRDAARPYEPTPVAVLRQRRGETSDPGSDPVG